MTSPPDESGTSYAVPHVVQLVGILWERLAMMPKPPHNPAEANPATTNDETLGWQQRDLLPILRLTYPPDGKVPDGIKDKEVLQIIEPEYRKQGKTAPSIDTIARARGRRKKYKTRHRPPEQT
jgi:hypothetical protein